MKMKSCLVTILVICVASTVAYPADVNAVQKDLGSDIQISSVDLGKRDFNENEISARRSQIGDFLNGINNLVSNLDKIKEILLIAAGGVINGKRDTELNISVPEWFKEIWTKYIWPLILEFQQKYPDTFEAILIIGDFFIYIIYIISGLIEYQLKELAENIMEIIKKIFGGNNLDIKNPCEGTVPYIPTWICLIFLAEYDLEKIALKIIDTIKNLPSFLKKLFQELQDGWLKVWNNDIIPAIQAVLAYLSEHNPKLEKIFENAIIVSEYVYIFSVALLEACLVGIVDGLKEMWKIFKEIFHW